MFHGVCNGQTARADYIAKDMLLLNCISNRNNEEFIFQKLVLKTLDDILTILE